MADFDRNRLSEGDFMLDDEHINLLADISNTSNSEITEFKINDKYSMVLTNSNGDKSILIAIADGEIYKEASKYFFDSFVDYGGSMHLALE